MESLVLLCIFLFFWIILYIDKKTFDPYVPDTGFQNSKPAVQERHTLGLVLRSKVPQSLRLALNAMNAPSITSLKNLPPIPKSFDCREKWPGLITGPLNQRDCGSCWAFSIATVASDRYRIAFPDDKDLRKLTKYRDGDEIIEELENFDPWHLASCNLCKTNPLGQMLTKVGVCEEKACVGQILQVGMQYIKNYGMILTSCDPHQVGCIKDKKLCLYDCENNTCKRYKPEAVHQIDDSEATRFGTERGTFNQYEIMNDGPLTIGISIYKSFEKFFSNPSNAKKVYSSKVKKTFKNDELVGGHAVSIVGWGTDEEGTDFWLIRNSWGRDWADKGYFRIERDINFLGCGDDVWVSHWGKRFLPGEQ